MSDDPYYIVQGLRSEVLRLRHENAQLREAAKKAYHVLSLDARIGIPGSTAFEAQKLIAPLAYPETTDT